MGVSRQKILWEFLPNTNDMRELSLHILDLVQNSITAGAKQVTLEIEELHKMDTFVIRVTDNGCGMDVATCKNVIEPFVTSCSTRRVGLGLPLIDMWTKRCGGDLTITSRVGYGTSVKALYQHSHLDRSPLGNIVETIKSIIIGNPELDFTYCHTVDQAVFCLATRQLVEILGDLPLNQPDILLWLDEYLTQNVIKLYKQSNSYGGAEVENT